MIYRTLYGYMLRELVRIFLLTAVALTVMLAFGGTFRPLTKEGLSVGRLMIVMLNLMPAMLAYAIPVAALFAAVLVYWRMGTDNEMLACRAGGISFVALVLPALLLGLVVASADLGFVDYVVPTFLQRTEKAVRKDLSSLLVYHVKRQEPFTFSNWVVYADDADEAVVTDHSEATGGRESVVVLHGMAATPIKDGKPSMIAVARTAKVIIDELPATQELQLVVQLDDGAAFDPTNLRRVGGTVRQLPPDGPLILPSVFGDQPKFMNNDQLHQLNLNWESFPPIKQAIATIVTLKQYQARSQTVYSQWRSGVPQVFEQEPGSEVRVTSALAILNKDRQLSYVGVGKRRVHVGLFSGGREKIYYECDVAGLSLQTDYSASVVSGALHLSGNVRLFDVVHHTGPIAAAPDIAVQPIRLPPPSQEALDTVNEMASTSPMLNQWNNSMLQQRNTLLRSIQSELNSRGSFALSCMALVLLGAGLGVSLHGRNPLAVFVVGFVPAIILVLLITAGRRMIEYPNGPALPGYVLIWTGDFLIFVAVGALYGRLTRQ